MQPVFTCMTYKIPKQLIVPRNVFHIKAELTTKEQTLRFDPYESKNLQRSMFS